MVAVCIASAIQVRILYRLSPAHGVGILGFCSPPFCSTKITGWGQEFRVYSMKKALSDLSTVFHPPHTV